MKRKGLQIGGILGFLALISFTLIWIRVHNLTKHIYITHPVIELHNEQEIIFNLLKGTYLLRIGGRDLQEDITFPFSISENIMTSSKEFHFEREYFPQQRDEHEFGSYVSSIFYIEHTGKVSMIFNVSKPEGEQLYLHLFGIE